MGEGTRMPDYIEQEWVDSVKQGGAEFNSEMS
jgi:hypothetical protein